jgi:hypothetical protein
MSEHDLNRIEQAKKLDCDDWWIASNLESEAESNEAKEVIGGIRKSLYHKHEGRGI